MELKNEKYTEPEMEVVVMKCEDIITTSDPDNLGPGGDGGTA